MYMRLVQVKVKPERLKEMSSLYDLRVIPALQQLHNCIYASLIYSTLHADECISLTLWETPEDAEAYEHSGLFQQLVDESKPFLADSSEWRIHLSGDMTVEYEPVPEEPVVKSYMVATDEQTLVPAVSSTKSSQLYVRIVSIKIQPGKMEEFKRLYKSEVLPVILSMRGCRYGYLTEGVKERNEVISITVWNSKEDADEYERSGWFDALKNRVRHTFSELYQWKMKLEHDPHRQARTSEDLTVEGYKIVTGKSFQ